MSCKLLGCTGRVCRKLHTGRACDRRFVRFVDFLGYHILHYVLSGGKKVKKAFLTIFATVCFIPYICAYGIANLFRMSDRENMPTAKEWFEPLSNI